uniref:HTH La-type RNA-binding domain-containing protein n=1 Tax=Physcomitrium patens TaxID=3218 RepID=A0A7I4FJP2_PHYPA
MPSQLCPTCSLAILSVASKKRLFFCSLLRIYLSVYLYISFVLTTRCEYQILDYRRGKNDRKVPLLSRSLSGSKLNAGAPEFVPKGLQIAFSTSLPAPRRAQELGLSAPSLVLSPSSVIPVLVTPPSGVIHAVPAVAVAKVEEHVAESRPSVDRVLAKDGTGCSDVTVAVEHSEECDQTQAASTSVSQPVKPIVTEELKDKILKQVEYYFSDANLSTDTYLMKFVKKDAEGFVPIPVVASFRKIKNLMKNHGVVAAALRKSTRLVLSEDGKKVRRALPLPDVDSEEVQARTVVAENLPEEHSIESMEQLFGKVGTVKLVRICSPDAAIGTHGAGGRHTKSDMLVSNKLHALVEYETVELAEKAVTELTDERNWRSGLRVRLLLKRQFQNKQNYQQAPHQRTRKPSMDGIDLVMDDEDGDKAEKDADRSRDKAGGESTCHNHHADRGDEVMGEGGDHVNKKGRGRGRGGRTGGGGRGRGQQFYNTHVGTPPRDGLHVVSEMIGKPPPGPRMPDGTRGFAIGRGRMVSAMSSCEERGVAV